MTVSGRHAGMDLRVSPERLEMLCAGRDLRVGIRWADDFFCVQVGGAARTAWDDSVVVVVVVVAGRISIRKCRSALSE